MEVINCRNCVKQNDCKLAFNVKTPEECPDKVSGANKRLFVLLLDVEEIDYLDALIRDDVAMSRGPNKDEWNEYVIKTGTSIIKRIKRTKELQKCSK